MLVVDAVLFEGGLADVTLNALCLFLDPAGASGSGLAVFSGRWRACRRRSGLRVFWPFSM